MFRIFFIGFFLFYFSAFGEKKAPETNKVASKVVAPAKEVSKTASKETVPAKEATKAISKGTVPSKGEVKASVTTTVESSQGSSSSPVLPGDSTIKSGESPTGSFTYHEALDRYREAAHLEWLGGVGMIWDSLALVVPVALELHIPIIQIDPKLTGLLQAGGMLWSFPATRFNYSRDIAVTTIFQAGLKYSFSNQAYSSFKFGPLGLFVGPFPPNVWTGGLFFGFGNDSLTMEVGLQSFYLVNEGLIDFGFGVNMGSVLKKWWSAKH